MGATTPGCLRHTYPSLAGGDDCNTPPKEESCDPSPPAKEGHGFAQRAPGVVAPMLLTWNYLTRYLFEGYNQV
jgi:hypothetical protein